MTESTPHPARMLTRRRMLVAGAWSVPVIAVAVAAPRAAASGDVVLELLGASDDALTMTVPVVATTTPMPPAGSLRGV